MNDQIDPRCPKCRSLMGAYHDEGCPVGVAWQEMYLATTGHEFPYRTAVRVDQCPGGAEFYSEFKKKLLEGGCHDESR